MLQHNPKLYAEAHSLNGLHYSPFGAVVHLVQGAGTYPARGAVVHLVQGVGTYLAQGVGTYLARGAVVHPVRGVGTYPVRCRGTASLGAGVLPRSVQRYCLARCRGTDPLGSEVAIRSDQRYESAFKQLHISPAFAPQTRIKTLETKPHLR